MGDAGPQPDTPNQDFDYDVLIIGAGLSGIYSLYRIRQLGFRVKVIEAGSGEGGTWFWNRYPGARFDSESISYGFSWSQEILDEWSWSEHFAPAPETRRYCEFVTNKFDLRKDMQFNTTINTAQYQEPTRSWLLTDSDSKIYTSRWLVTAMGVLNAPTLPNIPGLDTFTGQSFHTARWPSDASLTGKRVGIIGVGATGIQTITDIYKSVKSLTVFQRTPNWTGPLRNTTINADEMNSIRDRYPEIFKQCRETAACFMHTTDPRSCWDVTPEEREAHWETQWNTPGFGKWVGNFRDVYADRAANKLYSDWVAEKIRARVDNPETAEMLIPKCHGFGTRRVPLESGYYEAFNEGNVELVDVREDGEAILEVVGNGVRTSKKVYEVDVLVYATGFDAVTGAFTQVGFEGVGGRKLGEEWDVGDGPRTFLGMFAEGFPNMLMVVSCLTLCWW